MAEKMTVLVVMHRMYLLPELPGTGKDGAVALYCPIQVGSAPAIPGCPLRDDTGDNISGKNPAWCELTALYWAWKNLDADVIGLCHYRRYFGTPDRFGKARRFLDAERISEMLRDAAMIVPKKRHYWIETRGRQYAHAHHAKDLEITEEVIAERHPDCLDAWKWMLQTRSGHICNMMITGRTVLDEYCTWLFDILCEVERRLDISAYSEKDRRVFGYLAERLLDVYIRRNGLPYREVPMITLERQHWIRKGAGFLKRMVFPEKK